MNGSKGIMPHRLNALDACYGGRLDVFNHLFEKGVSKNKNCFYFDFSSCYPNMARLNLFPIGEYERILEKDIKNKIEVNVQQRKFYFKNTFTEIFGILLCDVLPPRNQNIPFLIYRNLDGSITHPLCRICSEEKNYGAIPGQFLKKFDSLNFF